MERGEGVQTSTTRSGVAEAFEQAPMASAVRCTELCIVCPLARHVAVWFERAPAFARAPRAGRAHELLSVDCHCEIAHSYVAEKSSCCAGDDDTDCGWQVARKRAVLAVVESVHRARRDVCDVGRDEHVGATAAVLEQQPRVAPSVCRHLIVGIFWIGRVIPRVVRAFHDILCWVKGVRS